eukprot:3301182-Rhodomonas_salina.1
MRNPDPDPKLQQRIAGRSIPLSGWRRVQRNTRFRQRHRHQNLSASLSPIRHRPDYVGPDPQSTYR